MRAFDRAFLEAMSIAPDEDSAVERAGECVEETGEKHAIMKLADFERLLDDYNRVRIRNTEVEKYANKMFWLAAAAVELFFLSSLLRLL